MHKVTNRICKEIMGPNICPKKYYNIINFMNNIINFMNF